MRILFDNYIKMLQGFKQFIMRGNVVDLAVGVVIGAAFGKVVDTLVSGIISPLIGAIIKAPDFSRLMFTLNGSVFMYGSFLNALISFLIVASAIYFFVVTPINLMVAKMKRNEPRKEPDTKICPECLSLIPINARRCAHCASLLVM